MASTKSAETPEEFTARVETIFANGFTSFGIDLGYETGLFDILAYMKEDPKTSQEIADAGNLKERYVREWLGAMVTAHIVELDSTGEKYYLPTNRVLSLTTNRELVEMILIGCMLPKLGGNVYEQVKECFQKDGPRGVSYTNYVPTYKTFSKYSRTFFENSMTSSLLSPYPELRNLLTEGIPVLDVGCGDGVSTIELGRAFPNSDICGLDIMEESVKIGREGAEKLQMKNVKFAVGDATKMPADWDNKFDFVFCHDCIHDMARPDIALSEIHRVLVPGGIFLALEPLSYSKVKDNLEKLPGIELLYMTSLLCCLPSSLYTEGSLGLGASWGREKAVEMITAAGMEVMVVAKNPVGHGQHFYCKKRK